MIIPDNKELDALQSRIVTESEFNYDSLIARPLYSMLTQYDIDRLYNIATSVRFAGNTQKRYKAIEDIMHARGFSKLSSGTNRIAFVYYEDPSIVVKVAAAKTAIMDSPREFVNQALLKPFCTKVFEVSPDGVVGVFERVKGITSVEEYATVADQVFEMLDFITGKYILADIGTKYPFNVGIRDGFGTVLLDFPYLYETDANKLVCRKQDANSPEGICGGLIDYDAGYNNLVCNKCGKIFKAVELGKYLETKQIVKGNGKIMDISVKITKNGVTRTVGGDESGMKKESSTIKHEEVVSKPTTTNAKTVLVSPNSGKPKSFNTSNKSNINVKLSRSSAPVKKYNVDKPVKFEKPNLNNGPKVVVTKNNNNNNSTHYTTNKDQLTKNNKGNNYKGNNHQKSPFIVKYLKKNNEGNITIDVYGQTVIINPDLLSDVVKANDNADYSSKILELESKLHESESHIEELKTELKTVEEDNIEVTNAKNAIAEELKKCESELVEKTDTIESLSAEIIELKAKDLQDQVEKPDTITSLKDTISDLEEQVEKYKSKYEDTNDALKDFERSLDKAEAKLKELGYETNGEDYVEVEPSDAEEIDDATEELDEAMENAPINPANFKKTLCLINGEAYKLNQFIEEHDLELPIGVDPVKDGDHKIIILKDELTDNEYYTDQDDNIIAVWTIYNKTNG